MGWLGRHIINMAAWCGQTVAGIGFAQHVHHQCGVGCGACRACMRQGTERLAGQWTSLKVGCMATMRKNLPGYELSRRHPCPVPTMPAETALSYAAAASCACGFQGLLVGPRRGLSVIPFQPNQVVDLPKGT